jgi:hypothetical protein
LMRVVMMSYQGHIQRDVLGPGFSFDNPPRELPKGSHESNLNSFRKHIPNDLRISYQAPPLKDSIAPTNTAILETKPPTHEILGDQPYLNHSRQT